MKRDAVVSVGRYERSASGSLAFSVLRTERLDRFFHLLYPVDHVSTSFTGLLDITGVINPDGQVDPDLVSSETRSVFKAQTPEARTYDDDGNLLSDGQWLYTWNAENRLIEMQSRTGFQPVTAEGDPSAFRLVFAYDYQGRRYFKQVLQRITNNWELITETKFLWSGNHIIQEQITNNQELRTTTQSYTWGLSDHLLSLVSDPPITNNSITNNSLFLYSHDANKNVSALISTTDGSLAASTDYDPFGNILSETVSPQAPSLKTQAFRFSNEYRDSETGFSAYKYRYYHPNIGRFLNRDPIGERGGINLWDKLV